MRLLLYAWNANNEQVLAENLIKSGFEVVWFRKECRHYTRDMELAMEMISFIHAQGAEAVVSFNYFPIISMICNTCGIPYYAWVYDCPHFTLYAKQVNLPGSHIGIFDREMVGHLEEYGVHTAYHVPLSADAEYFEKVIVSASRNERERYRCDVSFVGSLYTGENNYYDILFPDGRRGRDSGGEWDALIERQCFSYGENCLKEAVASGQADMQSLQKGMEEQGLMLGEDYFAKPEDILLAAVLEKKVTVEERRRLLGRIAGDADGRYDFRLYTGSDTRSSGGELKALDACSCGTVDYHRQMPLVFSGSRINLNISLRSIHSGIPLRALDIMACGGFLLTNRQPELAAYFEEGVEFAAFESVEECVDKVHYYLAHEKERGQIAQAGQKKVQECFSYERGLAALFGV